MKQKMRMSPERVEGKLSQVGVPAVSHGGGVH